MVARSLAYKTRSQPRRIAAREVDAVPLSPVPRLAFAAMGLSLCLSLLIMAVVVMAQLSATPTLIDPPRNYLPGSPLPQDVYCYSSFDPYMPNCLVQQKDEQLVGEKIYFDFDPVTQHITRSIIPAHKYTMGQLYAAWGKPDSIQWNTVTVYVYWGTRSVWFNTGVFYPRTRAELIMFNAREPIDVVPWYGFRRLQS